jgi:VanZ family protein
MSGSESWTARPRIFVRASAWLALPAVAVLSVVPGSLRPEIVSDDRWEHFAAYFIIGALFGIGYSGRERWLANGLMLAAFAGASEIVQLWIPDRTASAEDFAVSVLAAWLSLTLVGFATNTPRVRSG